MQFVVVEDPAAWEQIRCEFKDALVYSFSFRWLNFQSCWLHGDRVTLALMDGNKPIDIFAGIRKKSEILAGPFGSPGGCTNHFYLDEFDQYFGAIRIRLSSYMELPLTRNLNYEMIIDLHQVESIHQYFEDRATENARRLYRKTKQFNFVVEKGDVNSFYECYSDLSRRKRIWKKFPRRYFELMVEYLEEDVLIRSFHLNGQLLGSSLLIVTPLQIHNYFAVCNPESYRKGLPILLYANMIDEALQKGIRFVNCGPSSIHDGNHEFKRRLGARPREIYSYILNPGAVDLYLLRIKERIKTWKNEKTLFSKGNKSCSKTLS